LITLIEIVFSKGTVWPVSEKSESVTHPYKIPYYRGFAGSADELIRQLANASPILTVRVVLSLFTRVTVVIVDDRCQWSGWSGWSSCSHSCEASQRTRKRLCLIPPCTEDAVDIENCLRENCAGESTNTLHYHWRNHDYLQWE